MNQLPLDPVCLIHGLRRSEHDCLYCCLCFESLTPEECHVREDGTREDVCNECAEFEKLMMEAKSKKIFGSRGKLARLAHNHRRIRKVLWAFHLIPTQLGPFYTRG
jgi:hypothetical protein